MSISVENSKKKVTVNPLMIVNSVRDIKISWYWIDRIDFIDKWINKNMRHYEAYMLGRKYFLEHAEYTHLLVHVEDAVVQPDVIKLLMRDLEEWNFPVLSGWFNWDYKHNWASLSYKDLRDQRISWAEQYGFVDMQFFCREENIVKYGFPFTEVSFIGLPLTFIRRDIVEQIEFNPYKFMMDKKFGNLEQRGIMHDLKFCIECMNRGIPVTVDLRAFVPHWGYTGDVIQLVGKEPKGWFIPKKT